MQQVVSVWKALPSNVVVPNNFKGSKKTPDTFRDVLKKKRM